MTDHYEIPFKCELYYESSAAHADFEANVGPTGLFTQTLTPDVEGVKRGYWTDAIVYVDSANNRGFDLLLAEGTHADDQQNQSKIFFRSDETTLGAAGIADATLESFTGYKIPFVLDTIDTIYWSFYAAAGAFGNTLGRFVVRGIAVF